MVGRTVKPVLSLLMVFLLGALTGWTFARAPGVTQPVFAEETKLKCPCTGEPLEFHWKYCPLCGTPVEAIRRGWVKVPSQNYTPKQAVVAFYEAFRRQDGRELSAVLDVESIFTGLIGEGLARQERLPEGLQKEIRERVVRPSAKVLRYYLLDFVTSPAVREHFHIPEEASAELLEKLYYEEVSASEAIVAPSRLLREQGARAIRLRRDEEDGSWRIVEFPKFEVSGGE